MAKVFLILGLMLVCAVFAKHDEWYCKVESDKYEICRKCETLEDDCDYEAPDDCKCENMKFANTDYELVGGPKNCQTNDPYCYVSENSNCSDIEYSSVNDRIDTIWFNTEIYYSYEACEAKRQDDNTGNEPELKGVKIIGDSNDLEFDFETSEECNKECSNRIGECGSWSFDIFEEICYLHTVDSCCGQFGKRENNPGFISGYSCNVCWSTKAYTDCPCSLKDRTQSPGTAHSSGGDNHCEGEMGLYPNIIYRNKGEPEPFKDITKKKPKYYKEAEWKIRKNKKGREKLKTKKATLLDGDCCWTITGSRRNQQITMSSHNPVEQLDFYVKKVKSHKCTKG